MPLEIRLELTSQSYLLKVTLEILREDLSEAKSWTGQILDPLMHRQKIAKN